MKEKALELVVFVGNDGKKNAAKTLVEEKVAEIHNYLDYNGSFSGNYPRFVNYYFRFI